MADTPDHYAQQGTQARRNRNLAEATRWFDQALRLNPNHNGALHGRARAALDRGEADASERFDRALAINRGDGDLWLGKAQALDVIGDRAGALDIAQSLVRQAPHWTEALYFLAQLRMAAGDTDFTSHYGDAARLVPQDPNIPAEWCTVLASLGMVQAAADIASAAQRTFPRIDHFIMSEAAHASTAGDHARAEAAFARLKREDPERYLHEARHNIRLQNFNAAGTLLGLVIDRDPWNIAAWALRSLVWRAADDKRSRWLEQDGQLVQPIPLSNANSLLPKILPLLHGLHDQSPLPLGQSLRGGTQTRGILFDRMEPEFAELHDAIGGALEDYRRILPRHDATHPLLRHRDAAWRFEGSWSVRLSGGGDIHAPHIHPQGILSSALYVDLPDTGAEDDETAGWLEIGRPPPDLRLDLKPIRMVKPETGCLALFPSIFYHGTRTFRAGRRMTIAFDVTSVG